MVTGNILEESYRWQFTNSMLDGTLNFLTEGDDAGGGGLEQTGELDKSSKLKKRWWGVGKFLKI